MAIRADRPPVHAADWVIDQNPLHPTPAHRYLPFWPVPGLSKRDAGRGTDIRHLCHVGRDGAAPKWFHDPNFHAALGELGVSFEVRTQRWYDYSDIDVALGYRHEAPTMLAYKPASKLINAWLGEVPALLGPEPAYQNLRCSPLDYLPVDSARDVLTQVKYLQTHPEVYRAMVANGTERGAEFSTDAIRKKWLDFLLDDVASGISTMAAWTCSWHESGPRRAFRGPTHSAEACRQTIPSRSDPRGGRPRHAGRSRPVT